MILSAHQLQYLSYPGIYDKIDQSHVFVFLDHVQYVRSEWQNRNRIKTAQGEKFITVPVLNHLGQSILDVQIDNKNQPNWRRDHARMIEQNYKKSKYFNQYWPMIETILNVKWDRLADLNSTITHLFMTYLGVGGINNPRVFMSSDVLGHANELKSSEMLIALCKSLHCDQYLAGAGGREYMDLKMFERHGIEVQFQDFHCPQYTQLHGDFIPNLSAIDLIFNEGPNALNLIRQSRKHEQSLV